jgi:hypothetical protein
MPWRVSDFIGGHVNPHDVPCASLQCLVPIAFAHDNGEIVKFERAKVIPPFPRIAPTKRIVNVVIDRRPESVPEFANQRGREKDSTVNPDQIESATVKAGRQPSRNEFVERQAAGVVDPAIDRAARRKQTARIDRRYTVTQPFQRERAVA